MLVPETVHKTKYGVVNGKIVPQGTVEVEELVAYNIEDFSDSDLRALIAAGHSDYFDPIETQTLKDKGIETTSPPINYGNVMTLGANPSTVSVPQGSTVTVTLNPITRHSAGASTMSYAYIITGIDFATLSGNTVLFAPTSSVNPGLYTGVANGTATYTIGNQTYIESGICPISVTVTVIVNTLVK